MLLQLIEILYAVLLILINIFIIFYSAIVDGFLIVNQTGNCCIYVVFVAENFKLVIDTYMKYPISIELYIVVVCFIPCALMLAVRNLKWLAPFSLAATVMSFVTIAVVIYYVSDVPSIENRSFFGHAKGYPLFFGTVLFAVSSIGVVSEEKGIKFNCSFSL